MHFKAFYLIILFIIVKYSKFTKNSKNKRLIWNHHLYQMLTKNIIIFKWLKNKFQNILKKKKTEPQFPHFHMIFLFKSATL